MNYILPVIAVVIIVLGAAYFMYGNPSGGQTPQEMTATTTQASTTNTVGAGAQTGTKGSAQGGGQVTTGTSATTTAACALNVSVSGGLFAPTSCVFVATAPSSTCKPGACIETYALQFRDTVSGRVKSVVLVPGAMSSGTYTFNKGANNLKGTLTDAQSVGWTLSSATMTLSPQINDQEGISFDVTFANGVKMTGNGILPITKSPAQ